MKNKIKESDCTTSKVVFSWFRGSVLLLSNQVKLYSGNWLTGRYSCRDVGDPLGQIHAAGFNHRYYDLDTGGQVSFVVPLPYLTEPSSIGHSELGSFFGEFFSTDEW